MVRSREENEETSTNERNGTETNPVHVVSLMVAQSYIERFVSCRVGSESLVLGFSFLHM